MPVDAPIFPIGPVGAWEVRQSNDSSCSASRNYGSAELPSTVAIESSAMFPKKLAIYVVSKATGAEPQSGKSTVVFSPGAAITGTYTSYDVPARDQHFSELYLDRPALDTLSAARTLTLQADRTTTVAANDVKAAIVANDRCMTALYQAWGIDPARFDPDRPIPKALNGGPGRWLSASEDYPAKARLARVQGRVVIVLDVGSDGLVKACHVVVSADADLDAATCQAAMKRASYAPAIDAHGKPTASLAMIPVRWTLNP